MGKIRSSPARASNKLVSVFSWSSPDRPKLARFLSSREFKETGRNSGKPERFRKKKNISARTTLEANVLLEQSQ